MAVAEPCLKKDWEEWKREMEEKRSARWKEKVSYWANLEASDNEEEEEEEEATEREEEEGKEKGGERREIGMRVEVKGNGEEGEVTEWEEGEDDTDVIEDESVEEDVNNEVALEEDEGVMDVKVEELLTKAEENDNEEGEWDEEEHRELGETREHDTAEQDRERPEDQIEEEKSVAEPQTGVAEQLQKDRKDPHLMEEDEAIEVEKEVPERAGAVGKAMMHVQVHADEEGQELEQIGENDLAEQVDKTGKMDEVEVAGNLSEYDNEEEDCYKERINDEEQAFPNQQKNENSHLEGQHKFTDEAEVAAGSLPDDFQDLEEEEESDEEEAGDYNSFDEDVLKTYSKEGYLCEIFGILKDFRDASLFTDLTLSAADGRSFHTHAPVLAAVSSRICEDLRGRTMENNRIHICLGPEVDAVGLEAVVEFAYSGFISCLNEDTVHQIKTTAGTLGACRVTELCTEQEEKAAETGDGQKEQSVLTEQQITLRAIKQMWMEKVGCDIILEAIGGSLHAHRVILAACSDYFRCMFTSGMRECRQPQVSLPSLLASELEALISCSYSGALPLSWSCVFEITSTALQLQYQPVLRLCLDFLQREIDPHFCLDVASFAEAYALTELLHVSHDYVARQFQKVASTPKFKDLPAAQLLRYLHSRSLCVPSELIVFKAVVAWIQAKPKKRLGLTKELMRTIHFPLMTYKEFKEVRSLKMWSDHGLEELYEAIFEEFCGSEATPQSQYRTYLPKETLVVIGGDQTFEDLGSRRICRELWFANSIRHHAGIKKDTEWRRLADMPDQGRFGHEVAVLKGELYVFGGKKYYGTNDTLNSVYRYDPRQDSWEILAGMQEKRCSFSAVVLDGKIYAIGGHCDPNNIESVERYCPLANTWSYTSPLDLPLSAHAANILQGQIFVSGGLNEDFQCLASMFVYHPHRGSTYLANMVKCRAQHCMESLWERIYIAGGITMDDSPAPLDLLACEMYDPVADCWTAFSPLPVPHVGAGSAVLEGKFYVLGGYSQEDFSDTSMVHRYDPAAERWENTGKTPGPNNDTSVAVLSLAPHLRV